MGIKIIVKSNYTIGSREDKQVRPSIDRLRAGLTDCTVSRTRNERNCIVRCEMTVQNYSDVQLR